MFTLIHTDVSCRMDGDPCGGGDFDSKWYGVICDGDFIDEGNVIALSLHENNLEGEEMDGLTGLGNQALAGTTIRMPTDHFYHACRRYTGNSVNKDENEKTRT